jgi:hypothetical protein
MRVRRCLLATAVVALTTMAVAAVPGAAGAQVPGVSAHPAPAGALVEPTSAIAPLPICGVLAERPSADAARPALADGIAPLAQPLHLVCGHYAVAQAGPTACGPVDEAAVGAGAPAAPFAALITALFDLEAQAAALGAPGGVVGQVAAAAGCGEGAAPAPAPPPAAAPAPGPPMAAPPPAPAAAAPAPARPAAGSSSAGPAQAVGPTRPGTGGTTSVVASPVAGPVDGAVAIEAAPADLGVLDATPVVDVRPQAPFDTPAVRTALARAAAGLLPLLALVAAGLLGGGLTRRGRGATTTA